ncbi:hypothetical protein ACI2L1_23340 [Streptomyces sp. NPDC019531]|uniref:hypothetical protein n=1 Tax=Streptomyces sp. NPDC019531 TaxID=3365062 RepID=UPI0038511C83
MQGSRANVAASPVAARPFGDLYRSIELLTRCIRKAWPDCPLGCKRILLNSDVLPALQRPNVNCRRE